MKWGLVVADSAKRDLRLAPKEDIERINDAFESMRADPFSGDVKFLRGMKGVLRRRVGDWRVLFGIVREKHVIVVLAVKRRSSNTY